jgi:large subunit ribosomal protein L30
MARTFVWHPSKGPKTTKALTIQDGTTVRIKQVRSGIGHSATMRATLAAIGLRHHQAVVEKELTPGLRGQLKQVRHLVDVTSTAPAAAPESSKRAGGKTRGK